MKKKLFASVLTMLLLTSSVMSVAAADSKVITFKGEAEKFVTSVTGSVEGFAGMEPGESRELNLSLVNEDSNEMKFYMSAEILNNIAEKADKNAVYNFSISKNKTMFFSTVIGGKNGNNISVGEEYLDSNNNILIDTLAKGGYSDITLTLMLDGDSAGNAYMSQDGSIQLVFTASTPESSTGTIRNAVTKYLQGAAQTITKTIKTGDTFSIALIVVFVISFIAIILLLMMRKKKNKEG